jgi:GPH family glycoside/pentoside/hexuronide:cation symporter/probable glucitol transport protein GutA
VERTQLNSFRMVGTHLGSVLLSMISMPLILLFSGVGDGVTVNGQGYTLTTIVFAIIAIPLFYFMVSRCKEVVKPVSDHKKVSLGQTLKVVVGNKPLMIIFAIMLFSMTAFFGRMGVAIYYYMYVLQRFDLIALFMTIPSLFTALAIMTTSKLIDRVGKKKMCVISYALTAVVLVAIYFTDVANVPVLVVLTALYGICSFAFPIPMAMIPEAIDYAEDKTGVRADGTSYATVSLATKFASAIGGSVGIMIMGAFGYVANAEQTTGALDGINLVVNIMPAICYVFAIVAVLFYPLKPDQNAAIRASLQAKAIASKNEA